MTAHKENKLAHFPSFCQLEIKPIYPEYNANTLMLWRTKWVLSALGDLFRPKKVHFEPEIWNFLSSILINVLE